MEYTYQEHLDLIGATVAISTCPYHTGSQARKQLTSSTPEQREMRVRTTILEQSRNRNADWRLAPRERKSIKKVCPGDPDRA